jgi:hypothetical protein
MRINFWEILHQCTLPGVLVLLLGFSGLTTAKTPVKTPEALNELVISDRTGSEMQLEVRQMPLAEVLDDVARKTHTTIHYSILPEGFITATCVGSTLKQILECLLDRKADIIVRYTQDQVKVDRKEQVAEAWILGSRLSSSPSTGNCMARSGQTANMASLTLRQNEANKNQSADELEQTDELLKLAQSKNAIERKQAIGGLLAVGDIGDSHVKAALEKALTDQDPDVRAQAISSLGHLEEGGATGAIQEALHDPSPDVRLMAVDGSNDIPSLQQATNDSDETVRSLAAIKLQSLTQTNNTAQ